MNMTRSANIALFAIYMLSLIYPLHFWTGNRSTDLYEESVRVWQVVGSVAIAFVILVNFKKIFSLKIDNSILAASTVFFIWILLSSIWSIEYFRTLYSIALFAIFLFALSVYWQIDERARRACALMSACVIVAGVAWLFAILPLNGRFLGGIFPNLLASFAFTVVVLCYYAKRWTVPSIILAVIIDIVMQARGALIGLALFLACHHFVFSWLGGAKNRVLSFYLLIVGSVLASVIGLAVLSEVISVSSDLVGVREDARLDSTLTGRTDLWRRGLDNLEGSPIIGYGFRTRENTLTLGSGNITAESAHSGLINCALDIGAIGLVLFLFWYFLSIYKCLGGGREARVSASFLISNVPLLIVDPNYISFAHPTAFLMLLALCSAMKVDVAEVRARAPRGKLRMARAYPLR